MPKKVLLLHVTYHTSLAGAGGAVNNKLTNTNKRTKTDAATAGGGRCSTMAAAAAVAGEGARNTPTFVHTAIPAATTTMTTIMAEGATTTTTISSNGRYVSKRCDYTSMCVREMCVNCRVCMCACVRACVRECMDDDLDRREMIFVVESKRSRRTLCRYIYQVALSSSLVSTPPHSHSVTNHTQYTPRHTITYPIS